MEDKKKFNDIAYKINELLYEYVNIHNDVLSRKFSIREIIPIPFLFKPVDYSIPVGELDKIMERLNEIMYELQAYSEENELKEHPFYITAAKYISLLYKAVKLLRNILYKLYLKARGKGDYSYREFNRELDSYQQEVKVYSEFGNDFNKAFQNLGSEE